MAEVIPFPLEHRVARIREVARKSKTIATSRHEEHYSNQVTQGIMRQLARLGVSDAEVGRQLRLFWFAVNCEVARLLQNDRDADDARYAVQPETAGGWKS